MLSFLFTLLAVSSANALTCGTGEDVVTPTTVITGVSNTTTTNLACFRYSNATIVKGKVESIQFIHGYVPTMGVCRKLVSLAPEIESGPTTFLLGDDTACCNTDYCNERRSDKGIHLLSNELIEKIQKRLDAKTTRAAAQLTRRSPIIERRSPPRL